MTDKPEDRDHDDDGKPAPSESTELTLGGNSVEVQVTSNGERGKMNDREKLYFPNGDSFDIFRARCDDCKHCVDDWDNPIPPTTKPPYSSCTWGILDAIYLHQCLDGEPSFDKETMDCSKCPPVCKKFTHIDYQFDDRDPPMADMPGQITFDDLIERK